jgi:hypothetical protein
MNKKAGQKLIRFGVDEYKNLYFREAFTSTEKEFEDEFVSLHC